MAVVGDLRLPVGRWAVPSIEAFTPLPAFGLPLTRTGANSWTGAGARARGARVLLEEVDGAALRVDQDVAEAAARHADRRRTSALGLGRPGRRVGVAVVVVTARTGNPSATSATAAERQGGQNLFASWPKWCSCDPRLSSAPGRLFLVRRREWRPAAYRSRGTRKSCPGLTRRARAPRNIGHRMTFEVVDTLGFVSDRIDELPGGGVRIGVALRISELAADARSGSAIRWSRRRCSPAPRPAAHRRDHRGNLSSARRRWRPTAATSRSSAHPARAWPRIGRTWPSRSPRSTQSCVPRGRTGSGSFR